MPFPAKNLSEAKLLFVDDDEKIRSIFSATLKGAGYQVVQACDGLEGLAMAERENPALVLLDVDMPNVNGWQTLECLRKIGFGKPIIMLTGYTHIDDRVKGLSGGADDFLCKPCDRRELLARVHAALRRSEPRVSLAKVLHFGATRVDLANRTLRRAGFVGNLTRTEYAMLELFFRHPGRLVSREQILESVWGYGRQTNTRTVDTHIWRLRRKLNDNPAEPRWIQTGSGGGGYLMICD